MATDAGGARDSDRPEFRRLRELGHTAGSSKAIGEGVRAGRDAVARRLLALGVTPNSVTIAGFVFMCGAAGAMFFGGGYSHAELAGLGKAPWMWIATGFLLLAFTCDMCDGTLARIGNQSSALGAVLDSSIDRLSDVVVYVALVGHFAMRGNVTYGLLAAMALSASFMISYVKARSETLIPDCSVGYWFRGERCAALIIATTSGHLPGVLWQQAISPAFTVWRRLVWTHEVLRAKERGIAPPLNKPAAGWRGYLQPWRYPRGSIPYDIVTGSHIAFILFAPYLHPVFTGAADPIGRLIGD